MNKGRARFGAIVASALMTIGLGACSLVGDEDRARVTVISEGKPSLNPVGTRLSFSAASVRASITQGLVSFDEKGGITPALAARWIVTDDGLSYIFRLRSAKWADGREITAERVVRLLRERLVELRKSRLSRDIKDIDQIIAMTGQVIEIRLKGQHPNLLQLLAQPELMLIRSGHGAGPMTGEEENGIMRLRFLAPEKKAGQSPENDPEGAPQNEEADDKGPSQNGDPRRIYLRAEGAAKAITRFGMGQADVVLNGRFQHLPLVTQAALETGALRFDPVAGLLGFRFVEEKGFWGTRFNRELFAMAINRSILLASFNAPGWQSRQKIIPPALDVEGLDARPDWVRTTISQRKSLARVRVKNWIIARGEIEPLRIALGQSAGETILFNQLRADLRSINLDAVRVKISADADVRLIDEIAPYDSAKWFLSRLQCGATPVCSEEADEKIAEAEAEEDLSEKAALYAEAEILMMQNFHYVPIAVPVRWSLVRPNQQGFAQSSRGWHGLNYLVGIPIS